MATDNHDRLRPGADELERLISAARSGCAESLGRLSEQYRWYLLKTANSEAPQELRAKVSPSDLVQEAFLFAQEGFAQFRGTTEAELRGWLRQVLLNRVKMAIRSYRDTAKRNTRREQSLDDPEVRNDIRPAASAGQETPSRQAIANERERRIAEVLAGMGHEYQTVINLRNSERLSFEEIGTRTGRSADAARKLWTRAVDQLRRRCFAQDESL